MSWIDRLLGRKPPAEPAPVTIHLDMRALAGGRLSRDSESTLLGAYGSILDVPESPESDWRRLNLDANTLDRLPPSVLSVILADLSPDVSMALWNWLRLCNPGWTCIVTRPGTSAPDLPAQSLLDAFLASLRGPYVNQTPGANVVIGMALSSLFLRGSALMELVLDARGRVPVNIATPDPIYARYKRVKDPVYGDGYELGQYQDQKWVPFDRPTIISVPLDPLPTGPYGRPVAGSSLNTVLFLVAVFNDLRRVIQQQGWPRMDLEVDLPALLAAMPPESDDPTALQNWAQEAIDQIVTVYNALEPDEAYVHLNTTKVNGVAGAAGSAGLAAIAAIVQGLERRMARALKTQPMFLGITDSSTESQAKQQVAMQAAGIRAVQHALEDALTRLLTLALQVQGILADVSFRFSELRALEADANAVTDAKEIANWEAKVRNGWATADEAAMAVMGHPAVGEAIAGQVEMFATESATEDTESAEDSGEADGEEPADEEALRRRMVRAFEWLGSRPTDLSARVTVKPDGADAGPLPLPDTVEFTDAEIEDASDVWDELMPDYAGLLDADYIPEEDEAARAPAARRRLAEGENPWEYDAASRRYRDKRTGRWLSHTRMIELRDDYVTAYQSRVTGLAERVMSGDMTLQQWERGMRRELKSLHIGQYELGRGGRKAMAQADWGRLGAEMRRQYEYLGNFAGEIAAGNLSPAQVAARSQLYLEASTASYERGRAAAHRLVLPAYPGDGGTACRCITTPQSKVLTRSGWKQIRDVLPGEYVLTHRLRWRMVTHVTVKPSEPHHRQVYVRAGGGDWVGATDNHRWYTDNGWQDASSIDNTFSMVYNLRVSQLPKEMSHAKILQSVRCSPVKSEQAEAMQEVPINMLLWKSEGYSGRSVSVVQLREADDPTMAGSDRPAEDDERIEEKWNQAPDDISRFVMGDEVAEKGRWSEMGVYLGRGSQENDLPLPVGMDRGEWSNSEWTSYPSQESRQQRRPAGESGIDAQPQAHQAARTDGARGIGEWYDDSCVRELRGFVQATDTHQEAGQILFQSVQNSAHEGDDAGVDLRSLWKKLQETTGSRGNAEILFGEVLPLGTPLYDLTVDEDHSFVVEGLFAHNSNCKCTWRITEGDTAWNCYWTLGNAEHCEDCVQRGQTWAPYIYPKV